MRVLLLATIIFALSLAMAPVADALCVKDSEANLRRGPSTKYEKTWQVYKYMPFKKLSKKSGWYRVKDVDGDIHWIYGPLVTEKYKCAAVNKTKANIRTGPGTNYKQTEYSPAMRYYTFKVEKIQGDWVKVKDPDGDMGWIHRDLLWIP